MTGTSTLFGVYCITDMATLADKLRTAIGRDRRSLYAIAKAAGLRYSVVHRFATGERDDVRTRTAESLASALGCKIEFLAVQKKGG